MRLATLYCLCLCAAAQVSGDVIESRYAGADLPLTADPSAAHWRKAQPVIASGDRNGNPVSGHRTEIRSLWTDRHLYFLFTCPYDKLYLKPNPSTTEETNKLWEWDVAEVFIGADWENIHRYREFQVSPQGEWVDLDIDRKALDPSKGWLWNSGFQVKARIDANSKTWYGEMKIPLEAIDARPPVAGRQMRINLYRIQGPPPERVYIAWRPVFAASYHTPERFGRLRFAK